MNLPPKPIIAIGADVMPEGTRDLAFVYMTYVESLKRAGAIALLVPPQPENLPDILETVDGVLLAGGPDCDPTLYGHDRHPTTEPMDPRRQSNDYSLARLARERGLPTLGICLGLQMMTVASGGTLMQDIASQHVDALEHGSAPGARIRHDVEIAEGTRLSQIIGAGRKNVNSSHHQAISTPGDMLVTAHAPDGIIEGGEVPSHPFYVGVQWHPEDMDGEETATKLFGAFVESARQYRSQRLGSDTRS